MLHSVLHVCWLLLVCAAAAAHTNTFHHSTAFSLRGGSTCSQSTFSSLGPHNTQYCIFSASQNSQSHTSHSSHHTPHHHTATYTQQGCFRSRDTQPPSSSQARPTTSTWVCFWGVSHFSLARKPCVSHCVVWRMYTCWFRRR